MQASYYVVVLAPGQICPAISIIESYISKNSREKIIDDGSTKVSQKEDEINGCHHKVDFLSENTQREN